MSASLVRFRAAIRRLPRLGPAAERDLAERLRAGDRAAAGPLIEGTLVVVLAVAVQYRATGLPLEDLVQEGNLGLLRAVASFDPCRGARLARWAVYWIRSAIREYVARNYRIVKLGSTKGEQRALWLHRRTREARPEALAEASGLSIEWATALLPVLGAPDASLEPRGDAPARASVGERLADEAPTAEEAFSEAEQRARLRASVDAAVASLPARGRDLARLRLMADEPMTLDAIGATWGVSKERVRQVEVEVKRALGALLSQLAGGEPSLTDRPPTEGPTFKRPPRPEAPERLPESHQGS